MIILNYQCKRTVCKHEFSTSEPAIACPKCGFMIISLEIKEVKPTFSGDHFDKKEPRYDAAECYERSLKGETKNCNRRKTAKAK
jgi:DNA-directed RNA polymerase subunit RPC12/RpoP